MDETFLVVGLGNPGREYTGNRHNAGFMVADLLAKRIGVRFGRHKRAVAEVAEGRLALGFSGADPRVGGTRREDQPWQGSGPRVVLAKPLTYMNLSGGPVAALSQFYKIPIGGIVAIHDELDLGYGTVRAKIGGGEGGHNGLRSMSKSLGSKEYVRVRFGVGRPPGRQDPADFVLSDFNAAERRELEFLVDRAADVVETVVTRGVEVAQNAYNGA
jgi:peptidyl-tRNA hydrolase, PTH1 family